MRVNPSNEVLLDYMSTINATVETGTWLVKEGVGPSKKTRKSKKDVKVTPEKPVTETKKTKSPKQPVKPKDQVSKVLVQPIAFVSDEQAIITIPSKTRVFCRLKKKYGLSPTSSVIRKPELTHQGVQLQFLLRQRNDMLKIWRKIFRRKRKPRRGDLL